MMVPIITTLKALTLLLGLVAQQVSGWTYYDVPAWGKENPWCNNGTKQSPMAVSFFDATYSADLARNPLVFSHYNVQYQGLIRNNGHTVIWNFDKAIHSTLPTLTGSNLPGTFRMEDFHFHWGGSKLDEPCFGSEHLADYRPAPLEAHFLHLNSKYANFDEAKLHADGIAVLGLLFEGVEDGTVTETDFSVFIDALPHLVEPFSNVSAVLNFAKLVPKEITQNGGYYRYSGSLTMPPCLEVVTWTVFQYRIPIPAGQIAEFRDRIKMEDKDPKTGDYIILNNNQRPIQRRNRRTIWTNVYKENEPDDSGSNVMQASTVVLMATSLLVAALNNLM